MDLHGIDLNLMVAFEALMAERHVTRAAARIGRTQPAMSAALARLRLLLGDELFVRGPSGLLPTARALEVEAPIAQALALLRQGLSLTPRFDPKARMTLRLALSAHAETVVLPRLVPILLAEAPGIDLVALPSRDSAEGVALLDAAEADLAVGLPPEPSGRILTARLFQERLVCVLRKGHPRAGSLDREAFLSLGHVVVAPHGEGIEVAEAALASKGMARRAVVTLSQMAPALQVVAGSDLVATVVESAVPASPLAEALEIAPFPLPLNPVPFVLAWHRRQDAHPGLAWVRQRLVEAFPGDWLPSQPLCADLARPHY